MARPKNPENMFTNKSNVQFSEGQKSKGILDDFAERQSLKTKEGSVEKIPVNASDIVNKAYIDGIVVDWTVSQAPSVIHADNYTGGGDVSAAANLTDDTIITGDGGAKGVQDTQVTLSDVGVLAGLISAEIKTTDATDPTLTLTTTNTAHGVKIYLDEAGTNDDLDIEGQTAGVATEFCVKAKDGQNSVLRLYSGAIYSTLTHNSDDDFKMINLTEDKDVILQVNHGGVSKMITFDGSANELLMGDTPIIAADHGTASTDQVVNVCYGTGEPPAANTTTEGTLFVKYTA